MANDPDQVQQAEDAALDQAQTQTDPSQQTNGDGGNTVDPPNPANTDLTSPETEPAKATKKRSRRTSRSNPNRNRSGTKNGKRRDSESDSDEESDQSPDFHDMTDGELSEYVEEEYRQLHNGDATPTQAQIAARMKELRSSQATDSGNSDSDSQQPPRKRRRKEKTVRFEKKDRRRKTRPSQSSVSKGDAPDVDLTKEGDEFTEKSSAFVRAMRGTLE